MIFIPEQFSNGITIISLYLNPMPSSAAPYAPPIEHSINQIMREVSLVYCLPNNPFFTPITGHAVQGQLHLHFDFVAMMMRLI